MEDHAEEVSGGDNGLWSEEVVGGELDSRLEFCGNCADGFGGAHAGGVLDYEGEVGESLCEGEGDVALVATHLRYVLVSD